MIMNLNINSNSKILIYAEGSFGKNSRKKYAVRAKTADGLLRFSNYQILGVIDSTAKENIVSEVLTDVSLETLILKEAGKSCFETNPEYIFVGVAPEGEDLPEKWKTDFIFFLERGIPIVSGIHFDLAKDKDIKKIIDKNPKLLINTRYSPTGLQVGSALAFNIKKPIVLTVGSDAAIGKMTATYKLHFEALKQGLNSAFIPTGQTTIMIEGWGYSVDAIIGDFMAGSVEEMVLSKKESDIIFVEGQGSIFHPGFSNTTISLIHGAVPTHMILVHRPQRINSIGSDLVKLPPLKEVIKMYESLSLPQQRSCKVVGIALNTKGMSEDLARAEIEKVEKETELPTNDVIRFGADNLWKSLEEVINK